MLGTSGLLYTAVMMAIRFFDGSYAAGGRFHALVPAGGAPAFGLKGSNPTCFLVRFLYVYPKDFEDAMCVFVCVSCVVLRVWCF